MSLKRYKRSLLTHLLSMHAFLYVGRKPWPHLWNCGSLRLKNLHTLDKLISAANNKEEQCHNRWWLDWFSILFRLPDHIINFKLRLDPHSTIQVLGTEGWEPSTAFFPPFRPFPPILSNSPPSFFVCVFVLFSLLDTIFSSWVILAETLSDIRE